MAKKKSKKLLKNMVGWPQLVWKFIKEARDELKKVAWPSRETTIRYTIIVVVASLAVGLIIGGFDMLLTKLLEKTL